MAWMPVRQLSHSHLSNILSSYVNFALDPEVSSTAATDVMLAKDDKGLEDVADSFQQAIVL